MNITLTITTENPDEIARVIGALGGAAPDYQHQTIVKTVTVTPDVTRINETVPAESHATPQRGPLTVSELMAGMTLKPTATASLPDGGRIVVGDYVMHDGDKWEVCATYRGTIIATNEDGTADVLKTENCTAVAPEQRAPRPGTAAALLGDQHPAVQPQPQADEKITPDEAQRLRTMATNLVIEEKATAQEVVDALSSAQAGATTIDALTTKSAAAFETWVKAKVEGKNAAFGF